MRCPKCRYISFDSGERCRNCGYDFSLAAETPPDDLSLRADRETAGPLADFSMGDPARSRGASGSTGPGGAEGRRSTTEVDWPPADTPTSLDLPLFAVKGDGQAMVTPPAAPRPPLAVRRATPATPRLRPSPARSRDPRLALDEPGEERDATDAWDVQTQPEPTPAPAVEESSSVQSDAAPPVARLLAAVVDLAILGGLDLAVLYLTLQLAGLASHEVGMLPIVPFAAFLMILDGGYLIAFTTTVGQTPGKMTAGIRVVADGADGTIPAVGQAAVRALVSLVTLGTAGLGFLPGLVSHDRRALHDRLAGTRVIRLS